MTVSSAAIFVTLVVTLPTVECRKSPPTYTAVPPTAIAQTVLSVAGFQLGSTEARSWIDRSQVTAGQSVDGQESAADVEAAVVGREGQRLRTGPLLSVSARQPAIGLPVVASSAAKWKYGRLTPAVVITWVKDPPM